MIKHIVLMNWEKSITQDALNAISEGFNSLPMQITEIVSYTHGPNAKIFKGNADYALIAEFKTEADFKTYVFHPKHQELMAKIITPVMASYQSIQFNF
jgi:hypothetical protein